MFSSLSNRNFRIFFSAAAISVIGTFAQELALAWLVLQLTHSPAALGLVIGVQFLPTLLIGPYAGVFADRFNRRKLLLLTQSSYAILTLVLWMLIVTGHITISLVYALALLIGITGSLNTPTRLAFTHDLVGDNDLNNAVSLTASLYSVGRILGPALAGILISLLGVAPAFLINAISYVGVLFALHMIDPHALHSSKKIERTTKQFQAGLRYIRDRPLLLGTLIIVLIVGIFTYEYTVSLPALATITFHGNATTLALLTSSFALGSVLGGLLNARDKTKDPRQLPARTVTVGGAALLASIMPTLWLTAAGVFIFGFTLIRVSAFAQISLQLHSDALMRGRVLALFTAAWVGTNAIGGPIIGWVAQNAGPRWAIGLGGLAALAAAALGAAVMQRSRQTA
jgi:MFS family permease